VIRHAATRHPVASEIVRLGLLLMLVAGAVLGILPAILESAPGT
jgi:hypothetical protein